MKLNELRDRAYQNAKDKGFHDDSALFGDKIALMHSELSEALEEYRNGHAVDEIYYKEGEWHSYPEGKISGQKTANKPEGIPVELADVIIRILDFCGKYNIDIENVINMKMTYNETRPHRHGGKRI